MLAPLREVVTLTLHPLVVNATEHLQVSGEATATSSRRLGSGPRKLSAL
jgi:hypothetical protein